MAIMSSGSNSIDLHSTKDKKRIIDPEPLNEDLLHKNEKSMRPKCLDQFVGQDHVKAVLQISVQASIARADCLDHVLLYGPPGLGKTTLALSLAEELGVNSRVASAPSLERPRDIVGLLLNLQEGDLLFIDEIHRLNRVAEEILYPALEDFRLDLTVGKGTTSRTRAINLPQFTLIGATTRPASISSPLRDRFGIIQRLHFYNVEELQKIIKRNAGILDLSLSVDATLEIARRCRGTPRIANRLLRRIRDYGIVKRFDSLTLEVVNDALNLHKVDSRGLDESDRRLLKLLLFNYNNGPAGLDTLASALGEDSATLESVIEPFLLQIGFIERTHRGRVLTPSGENHIRMSSF